MFLYKIYRQNKCYLAYINCNKLSLELLSLATQDISTGIKNSNSAIVFHIYFQVISTEFLRYGKAY